MELSCFEVEPGRVALRASSHRRAWMDETPQGFAYRCVPLAVANAHGWEMLSPVTFAASWNGGATTKDISITFPDQNDRGPEHFVESHFGSGVLTFNPLLLFRTDPGYDLWIGGPPNEPKDGIAALNAVIETDWMPYTFSMSWRFTRKKQWVRFAKGEPIAFFFPIKRAVVEACEPQLRSFQDAPAIYQQYMVARLNRNLGEMVGNEAKERFQGWYAKGTLPDGSAPRGQDHRTKSRPKEFVTPQK